MEIRAIRIVKTVSVFSLLSALAACDENDSDKFEGVWGNENGVYMNINKGATEMSLCMVGMGVSPQALQIKAEGNNLIATNDATGEPFIWSEINKVPTLTANGLALTKSDEAIWKNKCL